MREIEATERISGYLGWPGMRRVFRLKRRRTVRGKTTEETVLGVTSLGGERGSAKRLLAYVRGHWGIENRLHWVRDATMGEDACRVRTGTGPQVLAALRNAALTLLRRLGWTSVVAGLEHFAERRGKLIRLVRHGRTK